MTLTPSAEEQGSLWGMRARDWSELQEPVVRPAHQRVLDRRELRGGMSLLDVGCGAGLATQLARDAGCRISGIDASQPLLAVARERVPDGDFRRGELLSLPWDDAAFDVVTGFNSFQYATDPVAALTEARRVMKAGGRLGVVVWGSADECEAVAHFTALRALITPPPPPGGPAPLADEQRIAEMVSAAGFVVTSDERVDCPWHYPDLDTALRALKSAGPVARYIDRVGETAVDAALTGCLKNFQQPDGSYLFRNKFRALTARS
ncbi:MAG: class I SAM-dependent methyltransferase [Candidatus Dormibacteria bacterium]